MCQHSEDFENLTFSVSFTSSIGLFPFSTCSKLLFHLCKMKKLLFILLGFRVMLTIALQGRGKMPCKESPHCPRSLSNEIILLMRFLKQQPDLNLIRFPQTLMCSGLCWLCIHWLHFVVCVFIIFGLLMGRGHLALWSTRSLLTQIVNPRPVCSNNFPAVHSFLPPSFPTLSMSVFTGGEGVELQREGSGCTG